MLITKKKHRYTDIHTCIQLCVKLNFHTTTTNHQSQITEYLFNNMHKIIQSTRNKNACSVWIIDYSDQHKHVLVSEFGPYGSRP